MEAFLEKCFLQNIKVEAETYVDQLPFETVLIPDGEFKIIDPQSFNEMDFINNSDTPKTNFNESLCDGSDSYLASKTSNLHDITQDSSKKNTPTSQSENEFMDMVSDAPLSKSHLLMFKKKIKASMLLQKEQGLKDSRHRISDVTKNKTDVAPAINTKLKEFVDKTVHRTTQMKSQYINKTEPVRDVIKINSAPSQQINEDLKECNIDGLKESIIEASRTLIKTEKSLRILGKLIHQETMIKKQEAIKHLRDFHRTVNTFRKTVTGIDQRLVTRYSKLMLPLDMNLLCDSKENQNFREPEKNIVGFESLSHENKQFEILSPAVPTKKVRKGSNKIKSAVGTKGMRKTSNDVTPALTTEEDRKISDSTNRLQNNDVNDQGIEARKRKIRSDIRNKIKTRILNYNRNSDLYRPTNNGDNKNIICEPECAPQEKPPSYNPSIIILD